MPEEAALYLADDLMRQGLLMEAERALRFARAWLDVSERVFRKRDKDDALFLQERKELEALEARETHRLSLQEARSQDARSQDARSQEACRKPRDDNNNNNGAAAAPAALDSLADEGSGTPVATCSHTPN
jgi:hypothetical protein